jgi:hypothetical protein
MLLSELTHLAEGIAGSKKEKFLFKLMGTRRLNVSVIEWHSISPLKTLKRNKPLICFQ